MNWPAWERLCDVGRGVGAALHGVRWFQQTRRTAAEAVRESPDAVQSASVRYVVLLFLIGMTTAGLVLLPLGLLLLGHCLLRESVNRPLVAGLLLCVLALAYLVIPAVVVSTSLRSLLDRFRHRTDSLASHIKGSP